MSGYDIMRFFKSLSWLIGRPSSGSLYPTLRALLEDGLATVEVFPGVDRPPRKIYSITEAGAQTLQAWIDRPAKSDARLKAFVMRLLLAESFSASRLAALLQHRRAQVAEQRAALEKMESAPHGQKDQGQYLALGYGLALATAELAWLDRTLQDLDHRPPEGEEL
jgi:PadR family transcriptional regulator AphA